MRRAALLTVADWVLLAVLVAVGSGLLLLPRGGATSVRITGSNGYEETLELGSQRTLEVPGPLGTTVVAVEDGAAHVVSSPCRQQICVRMGSVSHSGEIIVCVPNGVVVELLGRGDPDVDAVTR